MRRYSLAATLLLVLMPLASADENLAEITAASGTSDASPCREHVRREHAQETARERLVAMEGELQAAQRLFEEALSARAVAIAFYQELNAKSSRQNALSGADLRRLNQGASTLLAQRERLLGLAFAHECWLDTAASSDTRESGIRSTGIMLSLASALILYDNYLSAIALFRNNHALRQQLNRPDSGFALHAGELNKASRMFASSVNRHRVRRAIEWFEQTGRRASPEFAGYPYLVQLVEQSPSYHMVRRSHPLRVLGNHFELFSMQTIDGVVGLKDEGSNLTSMLFGNTVGLVETRHGKLFGDQKVADRIGRTLQAGDILLEKTPFRLTDNFIPGHWGHAAIWVGSEAELRQLGIWEHPVVRPHQEAIRRGRAIVEALRSGVEMNSVAHFLNIDDLAILRHATLPADQRREVILQTLRQVGKAYDFNFDAETTHRVFCSKLVYLAYGDLNWPTSRIMGRATVSPDNIATRALGDGPLTLALLFHDGKEIVDQPKLVMQNLMQPPQKLSLTPQEPT